jgi:hypothetical protein
MAFSPKGGFLLGVGFVLASALSCGTPGAPQPPSLQLPKPPENLAAVRRGDKVHLTWTYPWQTTEGVILKRPGEMRVCRAVNEPLMPACVNMVAQLPKLPGNARAEYQESLSRELQQQFPAGSATYAVEILNDSGRGAGLSNQVRVPLAPTLPPPSDVQARVTPEGVVLTWTGELRENPSDQLRHKFRVYRAGDAGNPAAIGDVQLASGRPAQFLDRAAEWERTYSYSVVAVTVVQDSNKPLWEVESENSAPIRVLVHDTFPPAAPTGVQAVFASTGAGTSVDLTWDPNTESDLAGYNLYRSEAVDSAARAPSSKTIKLNKQTVAAPAFRDMSIQSGRRYFYAVTAVDLRGNESVKSAETSEVVPAVEEAP